MVGDSGRNPMRTAVRLFSASCLQRWRGERDVDETDSIVFVIDDDPSFRRSTERLIRSAGYAVRSFSTATEFLRSGLQEVPACVVLDVRLPDLSGLDLQEALSKAGIRMPIIFITGHGDIPMSVQAMKAGAFEFLTKPFRPENLLDAIQLAIVRDCEIRKARVKLAGLRALYELLTAREREVMACVVSGMLNKQIAGELRIAEKTIKFHRGHIMQKMRARSLAELVRMAEHLGIER
jgi:FixJ family two-component response regulator